MCVCATLGQEQGLQHPELVCVFEWRQWLLFFLRQVPSMLSSNLNAEALQYLQGYLQAASVQLVWGARLLGPPLPTEGHRREDPLGVEHLSPAERLLEPDRQPDRRTWTGLHPNGNIALTFWHFIELTLRANWLYNSPLKSQGVSSSFRGGGNNKRGRNMRTTNDYQE